MIARVSGTVLAIGTTSVVLDVGGVGFEAHCTPQTCAGLQVGQPGTLATSLVVREDAMTLYGFGDAAERDMFVLLQTATGVGPRLAQAYLSVFTPDELRAAVSAGDSKTLTRVPGVGRKGAERLVVELKDRIEALGPVRVTAESAEVGRWRDQLIDGLQGLGWSAKEAAAAADSVAHLAEEDPDTPIQTLMRAALQHLAR